MSSLKNPNQTKPSLQKTRTAVKQGGKMQLIDEEGHLPSEVPAEIWERRTPHLALRDSGSAELTQQTGLE